MKALKILGLIAALLASFAHTATCSAEAAPAVAIRQVLKDQAAAWNAGDIPTFMRAYKDSPDTTFIGKSVEHGYAPILERYKKAYATKDAMGTSRLFRDYGAGVRRELRCRDGKVPSGAQRRGRRRRWRYLFAGLGEDSRRMEDHSGSLQRHHAIGPLSKEAKPRLSVRPAPRCA